MTPPQSQEEEGRVPPEGILQKDSSSFALVENISLDRKCLFFPLLPLRLLLDSSALPKAPKKTNMDLSRCLQTLNSSYEAFSQAVPNPA